MINAVNLQFERFVAFAEERVKAGKDTAIATKGDVKAGGGTPLEERAINATGKTDFVGMTILRGGDTKRANDEVRELFRKSIVEMFGGENNIPDSVKDAMLLKDYGHGKPLTARRILEVKTAIENLNRVNVFGPELDPDGKLAEKALAAGYERLDFGKLNTAANYLMQNEKMTASEALTEVITKGSAANRTMKEGSLYMKDAESFGHGCLRMRELTKSNEDVAIEFAARNYGAANTKNLSTVAFNLYLKYDELWSLIEDHRRLTDLPESKLREVKLVIEGLCTEFKQISDDLFSGKLTDRKEIYDKLFRYERPNYLTNAIGVLVGKLQEMPNRTPELNEFIEYLDSLPREVREFRTALADTYSNAIADEMAAEAKSRLSEAANAGGMATGTSGEVPAKIMDNLGAFLREDPFANGPKVDKLCNYLEKNGQAALRFSAKQKADLKALLVNFIGSDKAQRALERIVVNFENTFFEKKLEDPENRRMPKDLGPDTVYKFFLSHRDRLAFFDPDAGRNPQDIVKSIIEEMKP